MSYFNIAKDLVKVARGTLKPPRFHLGFKDRHMLVGEFKIEPTLGYTYTGLSGDYNILHINNSVAKMVGHKSAFLQGMATANILINTIFKKFDIENIDIAFVKPV